MLAHAPVAPRHFEQQEPARPIQRPLGLGTVNREVAAIRAGVAKSKSEHRRGCFTSASSAVPGAATPTNPLLSGRYNWRVPQRTASPAPELIWSSWGVNKVFSSSWNSDAHFLSSWPKLS